VILNLYVWPVMSFRTKTCSTIHFGEMPPLSCPILIVVKIPRFLCYTPTTHLSNYSQHQQRSMRNTSLVCITYLGISQSTTHTIARIFAKPAALTLLAHCFLPPSLSILLRPEGCRRWKWAWLAGRGRHTLRCYPACCQR